MRLLLLCDSSSLCTYAIDGEPEPEHDDRYRLTAVLACACLCLLALAYAYSYVLSQMLVPRSKAHFAAVYARFPAKYFKAVPGVYGHKGGAVHWERMSSG